MKNMKITALSTLLVSTVLLGSSVAFAAKDGATAENPAKRDTKAVVTFLENTDPEGPVDPIDPEIPVDPIDPVDPEVPVEPGTGGPLSLDYASSLNFGKHKISTQDQVYYANSQKVTDKETGVATEKPLYAQLTDKRAKNDLTGWTLSVTQNGQFKTKAGDILTGAEIAFAQAESVTTAGNEVNAPGEVVDALALTPGTDHKLMAAAEGEGSGTWIYRLGNESSIKMKTEETLNEAGEVVSTEVSKDEAVTLSVPGSTTKVKDDVYQTTLTWKLSTVAGDDEGEEPGGR